MLAAYPLDLNAGTSCPAIRPNELAAPSLEGLETTEGCSERLPPTQFALTAEREVDAPATTDAGGFAPKSHGAIGPDGRRRSLDDDDGTDVSFEIALLSDYRRGGVTKSGGDPALQISFDVEEPSGWSAGVSVTTIEERKGASFEVDLYGAKAFEFGDAELTLGATAVLFPGGEHTDFGVAQATFSQPFGPIDLTLAVNYAWEQANLDGEDNVSVSLRARSPIGRLMGFPLTAGASIGRSEGPLAIEEVKIDWSLSLTADVQGTDIGLSYVDTDLEDEHGDATCVLSIVRTF